MKFLQPDSPSSGDGEVRDGEVILYFARRELVLLANSLNEALNAVEGWEFETRLGALPDEARILGSKIGEVLRDTRRLA